MFVQKKTQTKKKNKTKPKIKTTRLWGIILLLVPFSGEQPNENITM